MTKNIRKGLLQVLKVSVAGALLVWVFSMAHWHDYVVAVNPDGKAAEYDVTAEPAPGEAGATWHVSEGLPWSKRKLTLPTSQLKALTDTAGKVALDPAGRPIYVRPGVLSSVKTLNWFLVALGLCGFVIGVTIMAIRYWLLLRIQDINITRWEAVRLTFLGVFFNYFMPGTVGGDLVKAYFVAKHTPRKAAVLVSVFVDRVLGLTELVILASAMIGASLLLGANYESLRLSIRVVLIVVVLVAVALTFVLSARFRRVLHLQAFYQRMSFAHHIAAAGDAAELYRKRWVGMVKAIGITFGAQAFAIASIAVLGLSLHIDLKVIPLWNYFVYVPIIWILGAIPISFGGLGLVEQLYITFFSAASPSTVLVLALLGRFVQMASSLPGLAAYMGGARVATKAIEQELKVEE